jgi:hypothetical protein
MGVQDFRRGKGGAEQEQDFFVCKRMISAVKTVKVLSNRMLYKVLRGCWCEIILNVHAVTEDKTDKPKGSFCEELYQVLDQFPKYLVKILPRKFNTHLGREDTIKSANGNNSLNANICTVKLYDILKVVKFVC